MKIDKQKKYQNKLLKLKLLKTRIYEKKHLLKNITIEEIEYRLKKVLHIIYRYHLSNKKILFIETKLRISKKMKLLLQNTKHILIPEVAWENGIITNKFSLKPKSDLIVILNSSSNTNALEEGYFAKIPIISLNDNLDILNIKSTYKVPGTFKFTNKKIRDSFFYLVLSAILKKANRTKSVKTNKSYK